MTHNHCVKLTDAEMMEKMMNSTPVDTWRGIYQAEFPILGLAEIKPGQADWRFQPCLKFAQVKTLTARLRKQHVPLNMYKNSIKLYMRQFTHCQFCHWYNGKYPGSRV